MAATSPKYMEIARDLQAQIETGKLAPGDRLPTEQELAERWDVSPNTVKQAVKELRKGGRVQTVRHKGTYVVEPARPFVITLNDTDLGGEAPGRAFGGGEGRAFMAEMERQDLRAWASPPDVSISRATDSQMKAFGLPVPASGEQRPQVVCRSQERFILPKRSADEGEGNDAGDDDKDPNSLQRSYFLLTLALKAPRLLESEDIGEGTVAYLRDCGHDQTGYVDEFDARPPTSEELAFFGLSKDSLAVVEHRRTAYDQHGDPFRLTITVYKPGNNRIRFIAGEVPAEVWNRGS
ncbi:GntR family transcriptional regulator [Actinomadura nitritigenes]|uniref:GntR family transcriptional regulator n=1 Tax=Actinomadura nitritigenes TaxID=134602 RepID=UPI003D8CE4CE